jgi:hypothetical protein
MAFAAFIPLISAALQAVMGADNKQQAIPIKRGSGVMTPQAPADNTGDMINIGMAAAKSFGGSSAPASGQTGPQSSYGAQGEAPKMEPLQLQPEGPQPAAMDTAMTRRMDQIGTDPYKKLEDARLALSTQPPELQREYAPTLDKALRLAQYSRKGSLYGSSSTTTPA